MARVNLPQTVFTRAGVAPAAEVDGDASNNHSTTNDGQVVILARNSNGGSTARVVTVHLARTVDGSAAASKTVSVPAGLSRYIGPFPSGDYGTTLLIDVDNAELKLSAYHY